MAITISAPEDWQALRSVHDDLDTERKGGGNVYFGTLVNAFGGARSRDQVQEYLSTVLNANKSKFEEDDETNREQNNNSAAGAAHAEDQDRAEEDKHESDDLLQHDEHELANENAKDARPPEDTDESASSDDS